MEETIEKYIANAKSHGITGAEIKKNLLAAGWDPKILEKYEKDFTVQDTATQAAINNHFPSSTPTQTPPGTEIKASPQITPVGSAGINIPNQNTNPPTGSSLNTQGLNPEIKPWYKKLKTWLVIFGGLIAVLVISGLILGYLWIGMGKTLFGVNLANTSWEHFVDTGMKKMADRDIAVKYADTGTFTFNFEQFKKDIGQDHFLAEMSQDEMEILSFFNKFSIVDPQIGMHVHNYTNLTNQDKPKLDFTTGGSFTNNNKTYTAEGSLKLDNTLLFFKYNFNQTLTDLIRDVFHKLLVKETGYASEAEFNLAIQTLNDWNNKWFSTQLSEENLKYFGKTLKDAQNLDTLESSSKNRNSRRISDMYTYRYALESYLYVKGTYPETLEELKNYSDGFYNGTKDIKAPAADAPCTEEGNEYKYTKLGPEDYQITFCLSSEPNYTSEETQIGMNKLTPDGFKPYTCEADRNCINNNAVPVENPYKKIIKKYPPFRITGFKGVSKQNGVWTLHYTLDTHKANIKAMITESIIEAVGEEEFNKDNKGTKLARDLLSQLLDWWLDSMKVESWHVWVGTDKNLYKNQLTVAAPSVTESANWLYGQITKGQIKDLVTFSLQDATNRSRDARRLADMSQYRSGLELFLNDHGGYPGAQNGQALGLNPDYLIIPTAPTPADGKCNDFYNTYWYTPQGEVIGSTVINGQSVPLYSSYTFSFCLGEDVGQNKAGIKTLSPNGVQDFTCPAGKTCYNANAATRPEDEVYEKLIMDIIDSYKKLPWKAKITVDFTGKDYDRAKNVDEPAGARDIEQAIKELRVKLDALSQTASGLKMVGTTVTQPQSDFLDKIISPLKTLY